MWQALVSWTVQPQVVGATPAVVVWTAGMNVTVSGTNLTALPIATVNVGNVPCTVVGSVAAGSFTCTLSVPAGGALAATLSGPVGVTASLRKPLGVP